MLDINIVTNYTEVTVCRCYLHCKRQCVPVEEYWFNCRDMKGKSFDLPENIIEVFGENICYEGSFAWIILSEGTIVISSSHFLS